MLSDSFFNPMTCKVESSTPSANTDMAARHLLTAENTPVHAGPSRPVPRVNDRGAIVHIGSQKISLK